MAPGLSRLGPSDLFLDGGKVTLGYLWVIRIPYCLRVVLGAFISAHSCRNIPNWERTGVIAGTVCR